MPQPQNLFINPDPRDGSKVWSQSATYYECGICGAMHAAEFDGDCRQDNARLDVEELDNRHGAFKWREIAMPGNEEG